MNQRTAKALRKAAGFKPSTERTYARNPSGQIVNTDSSPRFMYKRAKELLKAGFVKNVDINSNLSYNTFKQVTAPAPIDLKDVLEAEDLVTI